MKNKHQLECNIPQHPNKNRERDIYLLFLIFSFLTMMIAVYCFAFVNDNGYRNLFLLPFTMAICLLIAHKIIAATVGRISFFVFYCVTYLRFVIIPFLMVLSSFYNSRYYPDPTDSAANMAVWLMCYELLAYTVMLCVFKKKLLHLRQRTIEWPSLNERNGFLIFTAMVLIAFVWLYCSIKGLSLRVSVFMFYLPTTDKNFIFGESLMVTATALLYILCFKAWRKRTKNLAANISFGIISCVWVCVCFGDIRLSYVIKAVVVVSLLLGNMEKRLARKYVFLVGALGAVCIVAITLLDDSASHGIFFFTGTESERNTYTHVLQTYFSGPYNVAKSIELSNLFQGDRFSQFIIDVLYNSFPWSQLLPANAVSSKALFNEHLYGYVVPGTQIIPLLGQGVLYFGPFFSVVPPLMCLYLLIRSELKVYKNYQHACFSSVFCAEYASVYLAFFQMYNLIIICGFLLNVILIMNVIVYIQDHVKNGKLFIIKR